LTHKVIVIVMNESPIIVILVNYFSRLQLPITNLLCGMPVDAKIRLFCSLAVNQKKTIW